MSEVSDISDERLAELVEFEEKVAADEQLNTAFRVYKQHVASALRELQRRREHDRYGPMEG